MPHPMTFAGLGRVLLNVSFIVALVACGGESADTTDPEPAAAASEEAASTAEPEPSEAAEPAPLSIKLGWVKVPMNAPVRHMADLAEEYGIEVELVDFQRYPDMRVAIAGGDVDFAVVGPQDIAIGLGQGSDAVVAVAGMATGADLLAKRADLEEVTWEQLASGELTLGSWGGGIAWMKTIMTLEEQGFDFGDVDTVNVAGTMFDMMETMRGGGTDVVMNVDPGIATGVVAGYAAYADELDINSSAMGPQNSLFATNKSWLDRPEELERVLELYVASLEELQNDEQLWLEVYQSYSGQDAEVSEESLKRVELSPHFAHEELVALANFAFEKGLIENDVADQVTKLYVHEHLANVMGVSPEELGAG